MEIQEEHPTRRFRGGRKGAAKRIQKKRMCKLLKSGRDHTEIASSEIANTSRPVSSGTKTKKRIEKKKKKGSPKLNLSHHNKEKTQKQKKLGY